MGEMDKQEASSEIPDDDLFMNEVVNGDAELLYIDSYLSEIMRKG